MGRVYEALKRAAESGGAREKQDAAAAAAVADAPRAEETAETTPVSTNGGNGSRAAVAEENGARAVGGGGLPFNASRHFQAPESAHVSASTEQSGTHGGSALPAGQASRAAGATLGAAG